jgi:hypothetical protein
MHFYHVHLAGRSSKRLSFAGESTARELAAKMNDTELLKDVIELESLLQTAQTHVKADEFEQTAVAYNTLLTRSPDSSSLQLERSNLSWLQKDYKRYLKRQSDR